MCNNKTSNAHFVCEKVTSTSMDIKDAQHFQTNKLACTFPLEVVERCFTIHRQRLHHRPYYNLNWQISAIKSFAYFCHLVSADKLRMQTLTTKRVDRIFSGDMMPSSRVKCPLCAQFKAWASTNKIGNSKLRHNEPRQWIPIYPDCWLPFNHFKSPIFNLFNFNSDFFPSLSLSARC